MYQRSKTLIYACYVIICAPAIPAGVAYLFWSFWFKRQGVCAFDGGKTPVNVVDSNPSGQPWQNQVQCERWQWMAYSRVRHYFLVDYTITSATQQSLCTGWSACLYIYLWSTWRDTPLENPSKEASKRTANQKVTATHWPNTSTLTKTRLTHSL